MPKTSYALLGAIRSHRVESPSFDQRTQDRPNACNLCHLEQSERWAADTTARWFGKRPAFELVRAAPSEAPAGAVFALGGDAAVRAVTAAALGRLESSHVDAGLRRQLLAELATDDYAAVRFVAERSLSALPKGSPKAPLSAEQFASLKRARDTRPVTIAE